MTAGARRAQNDEIDQGGHGRPPQEHTRQVADQRTNAQDHLNEKPSCDMKSWSDQGEQLRMNSGGACAVAAHMSGGETYPMLAPPSKALIGVPEVPVHGGSYRRGTGASEAATGNGDDQSLLSSSSNSLKHSSCYPYSGGASSKNVNTRWMSFRGSSVPPTSDVYQATTQPLSKGGGCSVLLDKSIDLIELTTDEEATPSPGTCCSGDCPTTNNSSGVKAREKWRFSQNKCKSLDCATNFSHQYLPNPDNITDVSRECSGDNETPLLLSRSKNWRVCCSSEDAFELPPPLQQCTSNDYVIAPQLQKTQSRNDCDIIKSGHASSVPPPDYVTASSYRGANATSGYPLRDNKLLPDYRDNTKSNGNSNSGTRYRELRNEKTTPEVAAGGAIAIATGLHRNFDEEFRLRSLSLTPTVNLAIFETESCSSDDDHEDHDRVTSDSTNDLDAAFSSSNNCLSHLEAAQLGLVSAPLLNRTIPCSPSAAQLSLASSVTDGGAPICKICHMTSKDGDPLISPCRCSGTMQYIHCGCLMHWLEISSKKSRKPPSCELCQYQYHWHKKFKVRHWQFPHCSRRDKVLHALFFISVMIMIGCATITIMCFKQDKGTKVDPDRTELTDSEIVTLVCGVLFFLAFFVAMYVEVKARNTIYKLLVRFVYLNQQWYIDEYEKKDSAPVSV